MSRVRRPAPLLLAALVAAGAAAGCAAPPPAAPAAPPVAPLAAAPSSPPAVRAAARPEGFCRIGPDGGPPPAGPALAEGERGIGGTGVLAEGERGIGGTGIDGTGIVGVVTGFASICVGGLHVAYDPAQPVAFADGTATPAALRVGQVVVVAAEGAEGALRARRIAVRHELSGVVEAVEEGAIRVAGQRVATAGALSGTFPGGRRWQVGDAVLVSGLRAPDGALTATRVDPRPAGGATIVFGRLSRAGGAPWVGTLPLRLTPGLALPPDGAVVVRGRVEEGVLIADAVEPDRLMRDPPGYFGTGRVVFEAWTGLDGGRLLLGPGLSVPAGGFLGGFPGGVGGRRVVELRGGPGGGIAATGFRGGPGGGLGGGAAGAVAPGPGAAPRGEVAPMPDRRFERQRGMERESSGRWGGGGGGAAPGGGRTGESGEGRASEGRGPDGRGSDGRGPDGRGPEGGPGGGRPR